MERWLEIEAELVKPWVKCEQPDKLALIDACKRIAKLEAERDSAAERIAKLSYALSAAASCIKSGEPWTETCEREIGDVLREGQS